MPEFGMAVQLQGSHIIAQQYMKGVFVGIPNGIYCLQDTYVTNKMIVKKDITKLKHKQRTLFSAVLYIFAFPAFCGFDKVGGNCAILATGFFPFYGCGFRYVERNSLLIIHDF